VVAIVGITATTRRAFSALYDRVCPKRSRRDAYPGRLRRRAPHWTHIMKE